VTLALGAGRRLEARHSNKLEASPAAAGDDGKGLVMIGGNEFLDIANGGNNASGSIRPNLLNYVAEAEPGLFGW
jgi:hypothetical protein